jgi:ubiquinone/menaquinone biosynthesis C-methylase UbiE
MAAESAATREVERNRAAHDRLGAAYEARHPEIFNEIEQARLREAVARALGEVRTGSRPLRALDVGAGTGNLTAHLLALGAHVTAADVSAGLLAELRRRYGHTGRVEPAVLNGLDLRPLPDEAFDFVGAYSVLHHVPDYASLVAEMARVTRRGGVVYLDHERTDESWSSETWRAFRRSAITWPRRRWWYFLQPSRYWKRVAPYLDWRRWRDPRWLPEGDLHVWADDHVEWPRVEAALRGAGCAIMRREDYLLFEPRYDRVAWESWRTRCTDTRCVIARKGA